MIRMTSLLATAILLMNSLSLSQDTTLTITGNGNVGIGTTNPLYPLHVTNPAVDLMWLESSNSIATRLWLKNTTIANPYALVATGTGSGIGGGRFFIGQVYGSSLFPRLTVDSSGNVGIGAASPQTKLTIQTAVNQHGLLHTDGTHDLITWLGTSEGTEGAWIGPTTPYALSLQTSNFARLTITAGGNVGIGTVSPDFKLQVAGEIKVQNGVIRFGDSTSHRWTIGPQIADDGYVVYANGAAGYVLVLNRTSGNVGIGTTAPDQKLSVNGNASKVGGGSWATFSDRRLKKDIKSFSDGLSVLKKIHPVTFRYNGKLGYPTDKTYVGVIAQEIQPVAPYTVDTYRAKLNPQDKEKTDILRYDSSALIYIAINAIKELDAKVGEVQKLRKENQELSARISRLESVVKSLAESGKNDDGKFVGELR